MQEDVLEGHLRWARTAAGDGVVTGDEGAEHHHPGHPEEQDVVAGDENACGIELLKIGRAVRPPHGGERPQRRGEPGVQDVGVLFPALRRGLVGADADGLAVRAMPDRDPVSPPQLPRDAPVVHVIDPGEPARLQALGVDHDVAATDRVTGGLGHRRNLDPPLHAQPRLDRLTAALGVPDAVQIGAFLGDDAAVLGQRLTHRIACLEPVQAVELRSGARDPAGGVHDGGHRQVVPQADLEVVGIVGRGHLDRAGAELRIYVAVGDDHDVALQERVRKRGADQVPVALVVGVHRDRGVAEHGLDPGGRHHDVWLVIVEGAVPE